MRPELVELYQEAIREKLNPSVRSNRGGHRRGVANLVD